MRSQQLHPDYLNRSVEAWRHRDQAKERKTVRRSLVGPRADCHDPYFAERQRRVAIYVERYAKGVDLYDGETT